MRFRFDKMAIFQNSSTFCHKNVLQTNDYGQLYLKIPLWICFFLAKYSVMHFSI